MWAYLNWALAFREAGCDVLWLERDRPAIDEVRARLERYGLGESLICWPEAERAWAAADLLLNMHYDLPPEIAAGFDRTALLDIDPGLTQYWIACGGVQPAPHDLRFTIGERVGEEGWLFTPPCVALGSWTPSPPSPDAAFTTVSHWSTDEGAQDPGGQPYNNDKRAGFLAYLDLPARVLVPLELALYLSDAEEDEHDRALLAARGWRVCDSLSVASTPWDYQRYVGSSLGEWSAAKPSYRRQQNGWISDRTLCYLASGKPAVVEHTGPSRFLPDAEGTWRFRTVEEAARCLERVTEDYARQCRAARALAEEHFDGRQVATRLLERALA